MMMTPRISPETIARARARAGPEFLNSREVQNIDLSAAAGAPLRCKIDTENPVGSFKGRGATAFVNALPPGVSRLITASAGNFGLAMAYAGRQRGIEVTVYAAKTASPVKLDLIRAAGGIVKLAGRDFDEAKDCARLAAAQASLFYVEDGKEPDITAGAGTMAMEIAEPVDTIIVPLGNGALLAGIGCWIRAHWPATRIIGVCAAGAPAMERSWRSGTVVTAASVQTIADGIAVRVPVAEALVDLKDNVDEIVLVNDDALKAAMSLVRRHLGLTVEPSGAAGVAALLSDPSLAQGVVWTPITGANYSGGLT
jgi:threonine dehydratase